MYSEIHSILCCLVLQALESSDRLVNQVFIVNLIFSSMHHFSYEIGAFVVVEE